MKKEGVKSILNKSIISLILLTIILISFSSISLSDTYFSDEPLTSNNETVVFISSENADKVEYVVYTDYNNDDDYNNDEGSDSNSKAFATSATSVKSSTKESVSVDVIDIAPIYGKAIENFNAYSNKKNIDICACGRFTDTLKITNTGSTTTHYIIKKGGSGAKFVSYLPTELLLNPGESQSISMVGNVPCLGAAGSYTLQTYFETLAGSSKILTQQLNVKECDSFKAYPAYPSYKNAPCTPTSYNINIQNLKDIPDTFKLSLDNGAKTTYFNKAGYDYINKAYYKFTEPFVLLAPKEQKTVSLIVNLPCEFSETYKFNVNVLSTQTKKELEFPLYLTIDKNRYSFGLDLGSSVKIENYTKKVPFTVKTKPLFSFCSNDIQLIPVKLTNLADFSNSYKISIVDEDNNNNNNDALKTPMSVTLVSKQSALLNNYYYAAKEELGNHTYTLQIVSEKGKLFGKLPINVEVKDCTKVGNVSLENQKSKKYTKYTRLILLLFVFILIIILLLLFFIFLLKPKKTLFDELDTKLKEEESLKDKADEEDDEEKINKAVENLKADLKRESGKETKLTSRKETAEEIIDTFQDEESSSWWKPFFIFLIFIIGLLILYFIWPYLINEDGNNALNQTSNITANKTLITPSITPPSTEISSKTTVTSVTDNALKDKSDKLDKSDQSDKLSTETENLTEMEVAGTSDVSWWSKFLSWFNWLIPDKLSDVTILNETIQTKNETELSSSDSLDDQSNVSQESKKSKTIQTTQSVVFDSKAFITQKEIDFTYRYWDEDTALIIDLSKYFVDVDNDELTFTNSKAPYIDIEYNGTTAYLIPHRDWFGESSIVFTASDGKGGMASTPEIVLVVRHAPEWFKWLKHYAWYVGVGAGLIILLIIILISYGIHVKRKPKKILLKKK